MQFLRRMKIGAKIYSIVGLLSLVAAVIGALGLEGMMTYNARVDEIALASQRAVIGEQVNGLINAVVMDSRGVYMARDVAEAEKFGAPLLKNLKTIEERMTRWLSLMPAERKTTTDRAMENVRKFVEFRAELVRRGKEMGAPAAREYGDNEANRTNRQNLNQEIQTLASENNKLIARLNEELDAYLRNRLILLVGIAVVGIFGALALAIVAVRGVIVRPVVGLTATMKALATGDHAVVIPGLDQQDEIGEMSRAVAVFKDSMAKNAELERARQAENEIKEKRRATMEKLTRDFGVAIDAVVGAVASAATQMQSSAKIMSETAEDTSRRTTMVARASGEASSNVQTVATAAEELSASIAEIGRQVEQSSKITRQAVDEAGRTNVSVQGLAQAAQKIGDVVKLINAIAGQTNLLALNATIEAARAGEMGRGFAIVASEVKSLANQTAKATEDIAAQVNAIQSATRDSVAVIQGIGATIGEVSQIATAIASAVEEQGAATQEIARNVQEAAKGTEDVSSNISGVTRAAGETGQVAGQVLSAAGDLAKQSEQLRSEVDRFLAAVRAA